MSGNDLPGVASTGHVPGIAKRSLNAFTVARSHRSSEAATASLVFSIKSTNQTALLSVLGKAWGLTASLSGLKYREERLEGIGGKLC